MGRFKAFVYATPHRPGQWLWTYRVYDLHEHALAATDNTCGWDLIFRTAVRDVRRLNAAVSGAYYTPPKWLAGHPCPCDRCNGDD